MQGMPYQPGKVFKFVDQEGWAQQQLHDGSLDSVLDPFLTVITNLDITASCWGCATLSGWTVETACIWQNMFQPVGAVVDKARQRLQLMYPQQQPYVAMHLRLGGLTGEEGAPGPERGRSPLHNFLAGSRCATQLASNKSILLTQSPVLLITDHHYLRQAVLEGLFANLITPPGLPVHLDRAEGQPIHSHQDTFVDMVLMGWADCLVTSRSGFSLHAWLYGGAKACTVPLTSCL
jgi:hypothetical protein